MALYVSVILFSVPKTLAGHKKGQKYEFKFDRVFSPGTSQMEVFDEISQLVQVCKVSLFYWHKFSNLTSWNIQKTCAVTIAQL